MLLAMSIFNKTKRKFPLPDGLFMRSAGPASNILKLQAIWSGKRLIIFPDIKISTMVEKEVEGRKIAIDK